MLVGQRTRIRSWRSSASLLGAAKCLVLLLWGTGQGSGRTEATFSGPEPKPALKTQQLGKRLAKTLAGPKTAAQRKADERKRHKRAGRVPVTVQVLPKFRPDVRALESELQRRESTGTSADGETPNVKVRRL